MCILFIYRNPNPSADGYRFILASNRDEYYARPAEPAHFWQDYPGCLGGTDMEPGREGGTWLALNTETGKMGIILNLNGVTKSIEGKGRGSLVRDYITTNEFSINYANKLHKVNQETQCYNPYNLVMIELKTDDVYYLSSMPNFPGPKKVHEKILGFGNGGMEHPYQKVLAGKDKFEKIVDNALITQQEQLIEDLIQFLKHKERFLPDDELLKRSPEAFEELSSIFVQHEIAKYGTRTHSIILVDYSYRATFVEETLLPDGTWKRQIFNNLLGQ